MHNWQKPARPDMSLLQCRRLSPSCSSQRARTETLAFGDDAEARRWQATAWTDLWDLNCQPLGPGRSEKVNVILIMHGVDRVESKIRWLNDLRPIRIAATRSRSYPCDRGFQDKVYADRHRTLQRAAHVCDVFQNKKSSLLVSVRTCTTIVSIERRSSWTYLKPYITDIHREK